MQIFLEKFDHNSRKQGRNDSAFSCSDDSEIEEDERQNNRSHNASYIENDFNVAKTLVDSVGNRLDEGFSGVHNDVCGNGQRNSQTENYYSGKNHYKSYRISVHGDKRNEPQTEVRKIAEKERKGNLKKLYKLKFFAENKNLPQNQKAVPYDQPCSEGQRRKFIAHYISGG